MSSPPAAATSTHLPTVAVYGPLPELESRRVGAATSALGVQAQFFDSPASLAADLEQRRPAAVLVGVDCDGSLEVMTHLRGNVQYAATPLLGISPERTDVAFGTLYERGGDDLVSAGSLRALVSRLRPLLQGARSSSPMRSCGSAAVATTDLRWRNIVARTLSNVGIEPVIVGNGPDATDAACGTVLFVVASDDLPPSGAATALAKARARGSATPWVVTAPSTRAAALREAVRAHERVAIVDRHAPADNLLFAANELRRSQLTDQRASARVLFGTAVAFRAAGGSEDDVGFTYNVSTSGLFVRTLAPLDAGQEVWLELWPPCTERTVRMVGRVAWRRAFGPNESATAPPGFGIQLTGGLSRDLEIWEQGCRALAANPSAARAHRMGDEGFSTAPPPWFVKAVI